MKITLEKPWAGRPAGASVIVSDDRAWALVEAGIAKKPEGGKSAKGRAKEDAKDDPKSKDEKK